MIVKLGARTTGEDVVDLLASCHERIRKFSAMACAIANGQGTDRREAAGAVRRYFAEAYPLHVDLAYPDGGPPVPFISIGAL
jgi:hypothetical protein